MVFLGDYIYEGAGRPATCAAMSAARRATLADYRNRHAQYKTDPDLQRLHAAVPWLVTWDDHEVDNNYAGAQLGIARARLRCAAAPRPTRPTSSTCRCAARPRSSTSHGPRLYRRFDWGRLARFHVLDGRQSARRRPARRPGGAERP